MLAALLVGFLLFMSGGGGFAVELFTKGTQKAVTEVVADEARAAAPVRHPRSPRC